MVLKVALLPIKGARASKHYRASNATGCGVQCMTYLARGVVDMEAGEEALSNGLLYDLEHR